MRMTDLGHAQRDRAGVAAASYGVRSRRPLCRSNAPCGSRQSSVATPARRSGNRLARCCRPIGSPAAGTVTAPRRHGLDLDDGTARRRHGYSYLTMLASPVASASTTTSDSLKSTGGSLVVFLFLKTDFSCGLT
jgi:hypothetical protein